MAMVATFAANFQSFYDAVDKADRKLVDFGAGADKAGDKLARMTDSLSGRKLIQDATLMAAAIDDIGGVSKLTEQELAKLGAKAVEAVDKMKRLGMDVPKNLQAVADQTKNANKETSDWLGTLSGMAAAVGIAFSVGAITNFVGSVFEAAGAIKDQSAAVGMGAESFQRIKFAVEQGGGSLADFTKAANKLNDNLAGGSNSTVAALNAAGLAFQDIRAMEPDEAFLSVSDAVGKIADPMERARVAQELFGKGALALLPGMIEGYRDLAKGATVMSDETINRLEAAGDAWERLSNSVVIHTGEMIAAMLDTDKKGGGAMAALAAGYAGTTAQVVAANAALTDSSKTMSARVQDDEKRMGRALTDRAGATQTVTVRTEAQLAAEKKAAEAVAAHTKKIQDLTDSLSGAELAGKVKDLSAAYAKLTPAQQANTDTMLRVAAAAKTLRDAGANLTAGLTNVIDKARELDDALRAEAEAIFLVYQAEQARLFLASKTTVGLTAQTDAEKKKAKAMADALVLQGAQIQGTTEYNQVLEHMAYLTSVAEAEQRDHTDATDDATTAQDKFKTAISNVAGAFATLGQISGGRMGDVADKVGKLVGAMNIAATSTTELKAGFASFKAGNMTKGLGQAAAGAVGLYGSFMSATDGTGKLESAMNGAALGMSVAGPWGAAVGGAIGLMKGFHNAARDHAEVRKLKMAVVDSAGGFREFERDVKNAGLSIDRFIAARSTADYEAAMAELTAAFQFQEDAITLAMETAKKYGFTLEELGPALQRQELDKQAQGLYQDWQILNSAGLDTVLITERMADAVNDYINDARKMGIEVPSAMRPMLEAMVEQGELTDENGNKITDLKGSGINFAMTMSEGFERLITKVGELTDAITRGLSAAIEKVPDIDIAAKVDWTELEGLDAQQAGWWNRGQTGSAKPKGYARGTDGFENFGTGTPVVLHGWEAVVPRDNAAAFATVGATSSRPASASTAAPVNVVINAQGAFFDTPDSLQRLASKVSDALTAKYSVMGRLRAAV